MKKTEITALFLTLCSLLTSYVFTTAGPAMIQTNDLINFNWAEGSPGKAVPADNFSVRWTGSVRLPKDGVFTFYTVSDDGIRLWVDDQLIIDNWTDHGETENQGQIELWGGRPHFVRLEYYEKTGAAVAKLLWAGPGLEKQVIPTQFLFPDLWTDSTKGIGLKGVYYAGAELGGTAEDKLPPGTAEGWKRMAKLGRGFVVWESSRTGNWRIWHRALDGSDLRQLSPDEKDRDHLAPHIGPDGTRVVFVSVPHSLMINWREDAPDAIPMYLINSDGSGLKQISPNARTYGGDRAAVWLDKDNLIYLPAGKGPTKLNLQTGKEERLPPNGLWLPNRTMTCATTGSPTFSPYDASSGKITEQAAFGGCEPYFTADGVWGFWMGGGGGPINRIRLGTRQVSPIINLHDTRMPADRSYLYFPMFSPCQRLFAFAASSDQHDHATSDYDIFVAPAKPDTLELTANPVRYTFNKATDRYPDVFLADFELGTRDGEAPFEVEFASVKNPGNWTWSFGDGSLAGGGSKHTFTRPGEYDVRACQGANMLRGRIRVRAAQPPSVQAVFLQGDRDVVVEFDEPIDVAQLRVEVPKGIQVAAHRAERQRLILTLASELKQQATIGLAQIRDLAQQPNTLAGTNVVVHPLEWPTDRNALVFAWRTAAHAVSAVDPATGKPAIIQLTRRNAARLDHNSAVVLDGGSCVATNADLPLLEACRSSGALTIEATLRPSNITQVGPARIVSFSSDPSSRNFTLGQHQGQLVLRLRTPQTGPNGTNPEIELCPVQANGAQHVIVTYSNGCLCCYVDGAKVLESSKVQGDFSNWTPHHLVFGDEWSGERNWSGTLEGMAVFSRALNGDEAKREYEAYQRIRARRPAVPRIALDAELVKLSKVPTLKDILPYREALLVGEYRVKQAVKGKLEAKTVRVAHWALLDGATQTPATRKPGWVGRLNLETFETNPQLKSLFLSDTLEDNFQAVLYYDPAI
jgi:hypothetical protein